MIGDKFPVLQRGESETEVAVFGDNSTNPQSCNYGYVLETLIVHWLDPLTYGSKFLIDNFA